MADRVQFRRDTAVNWYAYNPILLEGEVAYDLDGDQYKVGDGEHAWRDLPYRGLPCVQQKGDSTTTPMSQKAVTDELNGLDERLSPIEEVEIGEYVDNIEFVRVYVIKETNQLLWGIQRDGNVYYGAGIPRQIKTYIDSIISQILNGNEEAPEIDNLNKIIYFLDGFSTSETLFEILDKKVDKVEGKSLIDEKYASSKSVEESDKFIELKKLSNEFLIEGTTLDGTKIVFVDLKVLGKIINDDFQSLKEFADELGALDIEALKGIVLDDQNYLTLEIDEVNKILGGRKLNGVKVEMVGFETPEINIGGTNVKTIKDSQERLEINKDSEGKIYSYREKDGTRVEHCPQIFKNDTKFDRCINGVSKDTSIIGRQSGKINSLREKVNLYEKMFGSLSNVPISEIHDAQNFSVQGGKKVLLTLHKRANNGYDTDYSAFLPNARTDFSDVRVSANGKTLPFMFLFRGNIDIIPDSRILEYGDSVCVFDGTYVYKRQGNAICTTTDLINYTPISIFNDLGTKRMVFVSSAKTVFVASGNSLLYRSAYPYTEKSLVKDDTETEGIIRGESFVELNGYIYYGHYQFNKIIWIERSADDGLTWETVYRVDGGYQHIHHIMLDKFTNTIYVGCDGGGGLLKSTDGVNWVDLRKLHPDMPQSTDYGIMYADANKRFLGGETSIVGGHSILKTTDDVNFTPILSAGKSCYWVERFGNMLIGSLCSSTCHKDAQIIVSYDEGETWHTAYITPDMFATEGASDGHRRYVMTNDELIANGQNCTSLRIKAGADNYYAQVLIDVPEGINTITVESGYLSSFSTIIHNVIELDSMIGIYRNNNALCVKNGVEETILPIYTESKELYDTFGSYISNISREDGSVGFFVPEEPIKVKRQLPATFHIGFYLMNIGVSGTVGGQITIISDGVNSITKVGNCLYFNGVLDNQSLIVGIKDSWDRIDINVLSDRVDFYINGKKQSSKNISMSFFNDLKLCYGYDNFIANFEITEVLSESLIKELYFSNVIGKI